MTIVAVSPLNYASGISADGLRSKFGGSAPDSISEYYRGAGLVPDIDVNAGVPTSGVISISDFDGASFAQVELTTRTINSIQTDPTSATSGVRFQTDGQLQSLIQAAYSDLADEWLDPTGVGAGADYDVKLLSAGKTVGSGSLTGPATGTWFPLSTAREWSTSQVGVGTTEWELTFQLRWMGGAVLVQEVITLHARVLA